MNDRRRDDGMFKTLLDEIRPLRGETKDLAGKIEALGIEQAKQGLQIDGIERWTDNGAKDTLENLNDFMKITKSQSNLKKNIWRAVYAICTLIIAAIALYK